MTISASAANFALLLLRVTFGLTLFAHGYNKVFKGGKIAGTARWFDSIGMRPGKVQAVMAASTEIGAGLLLAAGLLTPLAAAGVVGVMVVAGYTHVDNGFFIVKDGWEYNMILAVGAIGIATIGPGEWSIDNAFKSQFVTDHLTGWQGFAISAGLGIAAPIALMAACYRPPAKTEG